MKRFFLLTAAASATWLVSCAQNVGDIDLTQPDRVDVSLLNDGKPWWFLQTVIDIPPQSGLTFIGDASNGASGLGTGLGINRIVWDVQENWLIAYNNYEFIVGSQTPYSAIENDTVLGNGTPASRTPYFGTPAAAYAITSHFDIERTYNAETGEQQNVIEENTTDRPWYERQYIRVDWGNNAFGGFNFLYAANAGENTGTIVSSPLSYYVDQADPTNPDHMEITPGYIGIVNKVSYTSLLDPGLTKAFGTPVYQCFDQFLFSLGVGDCGPGEVKIRLSFEKIPDTHDFVPRNYTQKDELMFGVWENSQLKYDQQRGYLEPQLEQDEMATMHHIWQADHRAVDPTTQAPCNVNDMTNTNCIAPLNERTPKPIVYWVSPGWPDISDADHYLMWVHEGLISDDYNSDMRSVVAGALRGWDPTLNGGAGDYRTTSVEYWMEHNSTPIPFASNTSNIDYTMADSSYARYAKAKGLDYLAYPPELNPSTMAGGEDLSSTAADGTRPAGTWIAADNSTLCTASQITQSKQAIAANSGTPPCHLCDPTQGYCMGIEHVPYTVVPRMVVFCHNPVEPRQWSIANGSAQNPKPWTNPETGVTYANIDKSDSTKESSFDFSSPGDPDICDPRPDSERIASPLSPQLGDLRYSMHSWIPEPDLTSPGGVGLPASDPTTGEIVSAHANVYARAIEGNASTGADIVAVLNGWETFSDLINGNIVDDYLTTLQSNPGVILSPASLTNAMMGPGGQAKIAMTQVQVGASRNGPGGAGGTVGGGTATVDYGVANWTALQPAFAAYDPGASQLLTDFAGMPIGTAPPAATQQQLTMANFVAPQAVSTFNSAFNNARNIQIAAHVLMDEDIEPTALRLAKYYKDKFAAHDPCLNTNGITTTASADYRTCIWEQARKQILGNIWRSYSDHEVGHTFGMYHNFAGSTDALNYFDPYWNLRQQNTVKTGNCATTDSACQDVTAAIGTTPGGVALAPEWVQAPSYATLQNGLREYQYTSIMDYNARTFNSDFQGLGKYDHATHMYQYGNMVEIFDPSVLAQVPPNADTANHAHQIDDEVLQPFNSHYTMYPWIITDGVTGKLTGASTPLPVAIQKMVHARKWVRYDDLTQGASQDVPAGLSAQDVQARDGFSTLSSLTQPSTVMVPYRFCSDNWEGGTAWCMAFDSGADAYEQANGFIQDYKFYYYFSNFKKQSATFDLYDALLWPGVHSSGYYSSLWNRNFGKQVQIAQHWVNDEFIARQGLLCPQSLQAEGHYAGLTCGQDRVAAVVSTVDFMTKLMQSPEPDVLDFDSNNNIVCGSLTCAQDGYQDNPLSSISKLNLTLQPGQSAKADISTYSINQYGKNFYYQPTTAGIWLDKLLAAEALGDYYTDFIGELNSQPVDYAISISNYFQNDIVRSMGALFLDDPRYWPLLAVNTANPNDPANPPVTLYRNSTALANVATSGNFRAPVTPWCPSGDPSCSSTGAVIKTGSSGLGYQPTWEAPPPNYQVLTMPAGSLAPNSQPIYPPGTGGNVVIPVDPSPVYYEKIYMLAMGAVWYTQKGVGNYLDFLDGIKITAKGNAFDAEFPATLECDGHPDWVIVPKQTTCESTAPCSADNLCADGSACALRNWNCAGSAAAAAAADPIPLSATEEIARTLGPNGEHSHQGTLTGICYWGGVNEPSAAFGYQNCDPDFYQEYYDGETNATFYSVRFTPGGSDITDNQLDPYTVYSPAYEAMRLAQQQLQAPGANGLSAYGLIQIMRQMYQYWTTYQAFYGDPFIQPF